ncbi:uncharacterized protein BO96DRAFT_432922 [Aspergillus niger CBS 101883]|uniref:uncharacterized protein n=1 Tax=Aspergillus lacticoffeatus (strain CBS 101883) TaxID=1450533 RepID=UPI000D7F3373|nr:uncharacterized protein BO96DRAFT_432922 [Aspergillus niger CBS 101883]PYH58290.1 hypothetical protein BO96DRAFT_432922 [Aspergillus niger CBS 101883]
MAGMVGYWLARVGSRAQGCREGASLLKACGGQFGLAGDFLNAVEILFCSLIETRGNVSQRVNGIILHDEGFITSKLQRTKRTHLLRSPGWESYGGSMNRKTGCGKLWIASKLYLWSWRCPQHLSTCIMLFNQTPMISTRCPVQLDVLSVHSSLETAEDFPVAVPRALYKWHYLVERFALLRLTIDTVTSPRANASSPWVGRIHVNEAFAMGDYNGPVETTIPWQPFCQSYCHVNDSRCHA